MKSFIYNIVRLRKYFFNPSHEIYENQVRLYTNNLISEISKPISFITIFVWLNFAFFIDPKHHPEFPEIFFLRIGLSVISFIVFILSFVVSLKKYIHFGIIIIAFYAMISCSIFTAKLVGDKDYLSGYQLLIMILAIFPVRLLFLYSIYLSGFLTFGISLYIFRPSFNMNTIEYTLNNFGIAIIFAFAMSYFLKKFRINLFINHLKIMELKEKQDADYFLYNLLLKPFQKIEKLDTNIPYDFHISQKKRFTFRGREYEIGGDLINLYNIIINNKKYIVFLNADAMGKSIQGAGGIVVLGVVLEGILKTQNNIDGLTPEEWLKNTFYEIQKSFEKFKGSMLISMILGLWDELGNIYYFNSEHPSPILYRNKKAEFLNKEEFNFKIGLENNFQDKDIIKINQFKMQKGDSIFIGSDGKDDIEIYNTKQKEYFINSDEFKILKIIENSNGNATEIIRSIYKSGNIIDDISILKIGPY